MGKFGSTNTSNESQNRYNKLVNKNLGFFITKNYAIIELWRGRLSTSRPQWALSRVEYHISEADISLR